MADRRQGTSETDKGDVRNRVAPQGRDARLKAALKANIARRKARAQALDDDHPGDTPPDPPKEE